MASMTRSLLVVVAWPADELLAIWRRSLANSSSCILSWGSLIFEANSRVRLTRESSRRRELSSSLLASTRLLLLLLLLQPCLLRATSFLPVDASSLTISYFHISSVSLNSSLPLDDLLCWERRTRIGLDVTWSVVQNASSSSPNASGGDRTHQHMSRDPT